ncbi:MAG: T9SS type A sorting domain-containing protein [Prolixibacteraceae bacterium]|jgi:hypothetical protein|nr:T9SS type A sorting domain-containing protein [Prolixibacteraceae bacterium]
MKRILYVAILLLFVEYTYSQSISPTLFGQNAWMPSWYYNGKLDAIWQKAKPANFEIIRIGGIDYEDNFDEHIDDFIRFIDSIKFTCNAEPILQVPRNYTIEQTNTLYQLINETNSKAVKYWSIGNEPDYHNPNTLSEISEYFIRIAKTLKDKNDSIVVIGPDYANYWIHPGDQWDAGKTVYSDFINAVGMEMNSDSTAYLLDVFSFHNYVGYTIDDNIDNQNIKQLVNNIQSTLTQINNKREVGRANKASWGIGEFNINQNNDSRRKPWSFYAGQYLAMVYGFGMEKEAAFICPWSLIEGEYRKSTDLSMFENEANNFTPRSSFWHTKMLTDYRRDNFMQSSSSEQLIKTIGMKDETGSTLMIMNTDETQGYSTQIKLNMDSGIPDELNINMNAAFDFEYHDWIPANSTTTLVFDSEGQFARKIIYTKTDADQYNAPIEADLIPTAINTPIKYDLSFFYNHPSNSLIFKGSLASELKQITIFDINGRSIIQNETNGDELDLTFLEKGVYLISINHCGSVTRGKFVKH